MKEMNIIVGSTNPAKVNAVKEVFYEKMVDSKVVPSHVSPQPFSDDETRQGAINRAVACTSSDTMGIGLEGGVMYVEEQLFLCNWGALVIPDQTIFTASGARIPLPKEIDIQLEHGMELGDIMNAYAKRKNVGKKEGAIGIFTNEMISRQTMFSHVVKLLRGQWEYNSR